MSKHPAGNLEAAPDPKLNSPARKNPEIAWSAARRSTPSRYDSWKRHLTLRVVMKPIVLAVACWLLAALPGAAAQDLNRLELGIHDLAK